jgi:dTDP-4-amino-4,6-dideoxygalactose transaminase
VRSSQDLLLQAVCWPPGSEILVSAITVPDMPRLLLCHGLVPVPLDIDPQTLWVRCDDVDARITSKTRAIIAAHLFGSALRLDELAETARRRGIMLLEDCPQAYDGQFRGDAGSDVRMFSFGPIKTATALGGAVLQVADRQLLARMREIHAGYRCQSRNAQAQRIALACLFKALSVPALFTMFAESCRILGSDYDMLVAEGLRGFRRADLLDQIRRAPSIALLKMLERQVTSDIAARVARRVGLANKILPNLDPKLRVGAGVSQHSHWIIPILSHDPEGLVRFLRSQGFDATRKASHLAVVAAPPGRPDLEPTNAREILSKLVFLPVHPALTDSNIKQLCGAVHEFESQQPQLLLAKSSDAISLGPSRVDHV